MRFLRPLLFCLPLLLSHSAYAHHAFASEFDAEVQGEVSGTITKVWFRNPHVRYRLAVTNADGVIEDWDVQATSLTSIRRAGWTKDTIPVGEAVRIWGDMGRNGSK